MAKTIEQLDAVSAALDAAKAAKDGFQASREAYTEKLRALDAALEPFREEPAEV